MNADHNNKGVGLEEADGRADLDDASGGNRGDTGDIFPGSSNKRRFDNGSNPNSQGTIAVCDIGDPADPGTANVLITTGTCPGGPNCTSSIGPPPGSGGSGPLGGWVVLLVPPLLLALALLYRGRRKQTTVPA